MKNLISQVHLFVALDVRFSPGPILQALDYYRVKDWQSETVLVCDISWKPYVNIDQPIIFLNKNDFYTNDSGQSEIVNTQNLDQFLEQLDCFDIKNITQIGQLSWGRWLQAYLNEIPNVTYNKIAENQVAVSSIELLNELASELSIDLSLPPLEKPRSTAIYIDPYDGDKISPLFLELMKKKDVTQLPEWLNIIVKNNDHKKFKDLKIKDHLVDHIDSEISLFNQFVLCFSDQSAFAQTSRSYNVALLNSSTDQSLFVQGDLSIQATSDMHFSELINILSYWKANRLRELAFQWFNMGIEIQIVEFFHSRIVKRNLLNYSTDLLHCQKIVNLYAQNGGTPSNREVMDLIFLMRRENNNDPYSLSFSLKILVMITERMLASAACGERLFQRLGSDYHRIIIGEALIETIIEKSELPIDQIDLNKQLKSFLKLLLEIDYKNDQAENYRQNKEY